MRSQLVRSQRAAVASWSLVDIQFVPTATQSGGVPQDTSYGPHGDPLP
jgi:hypothetical protein